MALGINKGDHVGVWWATNYPEWVVAQFATAKIGAVMVTVNPAYRTHELEYLLRQSDAVALVLIGSFRTSDLCCHAEPGNPGVGRRGPGPIALRKSCPTCATSIFVPPYDSGRGTAGECPPGMFSWGDMRARGRGNQPCGPDSAPAGMPPGRRNLHHVHVRHHRKPQGCYAHPPQPGCQRHLHHAGACDSPSMTASAYPSPSTNCFGSVLGTLVCATTARGYGNPFGILRPQQSPGIG